MRKATTLLLAALLGFIAASWACLRYDQTQTERFIKAAWVPLSTAAKTGDDLMALDWARHFENLEGVEAFQAIWRGKILAAGGRGTLLEGVTGPSFRWVPPSTYRARLSESFPQLGTLGLEVVTRADPGPLPCGLLGSVLCVLGALLAWGTVQSGSGNSLKPSITPIAPVRPSHDTPSSTQQEKTPLPPPSERFLRFSPRWSVQSASDEWGTFWGESLETLQGRHLMEMDPHPDLVVLIEKSQNGVASTGFNRFPNQAVRCTPLPEGGFELTLEAPLTPSRKP